MYNVTGLLFIFTLVHIVLRGGEKVLPYTSHIGMQPRSLVLSPTLGTRFIGMYRQKW